MAELLVYRQYDGITECQWTALRQTTPTFRTIVYERRPVDEGVGAEHGQPFPIRLTMIPRFQVSYVSYCPYPCETGLLRIRDDRDTWDT
jgi:hypothetical protein